MEASATKVRVSKLCFAGREQAPTTSNRNNKNNTTMTRLVLCYLFLLMNRTTLSTTQVLASLSLSERTVLAFQIQQQRSHLLSANDRGCIERTNKKIISGGKLSGLLIGDGTTCERRTTNIQARNLCTTGGVKNDNESNMDDNNNEQTVFTKSSNDVPVVRLYQRNDVIRRIGIASVAAVTGIVVEGDALAASNSDKELIEALKPIFGSDESAQTGEDGISIQQSMLDSSGNNIDSDAVIPISPTIDMLPPGANPFEMSPIRVPRVGYSYYKTDPKMASKALQLALEAGVRHFDVATQYGSNSEIGNVLLGTLSDLNLERNQIFISHKVSNNEQSTSKKKVKESVKRAMKELNAGVYLDCAYLHSPLTDKERRIQSYKALIELQQAGQVRLVGVCHFGIDALNELVVENGLPPPSIIQLALSPFNQHKDIVQWAKNHGSVVCCSAWSKLSSAQGPQDGWSKVADLAKIYGVTKAQILVKWALQKSYLCVPRSGVGSKIERLAIQENSFSGVSGFTLSQDNMKLLNSLDEQLPLGRLGVLDGYEEADIVNDKWDPTQFV